MAAVFDPSRLASDEPQPFTPPSTPSGPYRGSRPLWAVTANPLSLNQTQLDALATVRHQPRDPDARSRPDYEARLANACLRGEEK